MHPPTYVDKVLLALEGGICSYGTFANRPWSTSLNVARGVPAVAVNIRATAQSR